MKRKISKKGSMIPPKVLGLILAVFVFVIILFFYYKLALGEEVDKNACRSSVLVSASIPGGIKELVGFPFKCYTEKICVISSYFGDCEEFKGEKNVIYKRVDSPLEIKAIFAEAMYDCWWQFYMGKNNLFDRSAFEEQTFCALCSRIAFDKATKDKYLAVRGLGNYLKTQKIPSSSKKYFEYFFQDFGNLNTLDTQEIPLDTKQQYAVVYDIIEKDNLKYTVIKMGGCAGGAVLGLKVGTAIAFVPVVGWVAGPVAGMAITAAGCYGGAKVGEQVDTITTQNGFLVSINVREYSATKLGYCNKLITIP